MSDIADNNILNRLKIKSNYTFHCIDIVSNDTGYIYLIDNEVPLKFTISQVEENKYILSYNKKQLYFLIKDRVIKKKHVKEWHLIKSLEINEGNIKEGTPPAGSYFSDFLDAWNDSTQKDISGCLKYSKEVEDENNAEGYPFE